MGRFDNKIKQCSGKMPQHIEDSLIFANDTIEFCKCIAEDQFGTYCTPDHVIAIFKIVEHTVIYGANTIKTNEG